MVAIYKRRVNGVIPDERVENKGGKTDISCCASKIQETVGAKLQGLPNIFFVVLLLMI